MVSSGWTITLKGHWDNGGRHEEAKIHGVYGGSWVSLMGMRGCRVEAMGGTHVCCMVHADTSESPDFRSAGTINPKPCTPHRCSYLGS